jgi:hypothetical protein
VERLDQVFGCGNTDCANASNVCYDAWIGKAYSVVILTFTLQKQNGTQRSLLTAEYAEYAECIELEIPRAPRIPRLKNAWNANHPERETNAKAER